ncbi:MAG: cupin domain-containing protein [Bryobacteraceae bacterium]
MSVQELAQSVIRLGSEGERMELGGFKVIFKSPLSGSKEGWMAADYTLPAGQMGAQPHYHNHLTESFYVISGNLWMRIGEREVIAGLGSYALVSPGTRHSFANWSDQPMHFMAHASDASHKEFLCELFRMIESEPAWPPQDPTRMLALGRRYDIYYL